MGLGSRFYSFVIEQKCVPWFISQRFGRWIEEDVRERLPTIYQFLHFRRIRDVVRPVTFGPGHHFFGYYDKCPWNSSGRLMLGHEVAFNDRPPTEDDSAVVGVIKLDHDCAFKPIATTFAWNWQQGSMLQWHPADPERFIVYNDRRGDRFVSIVRDCDGAELRSYERPIYALTPNGRWALSLNFSRLHAYRPGYGYPGMQDRCLEENHPADDGIWLLDLDSGASTLVVSLDQLARFDPTGDMAGVPHWVNHIQISPDGQRFAFFHLWRFGAKSWRVRLFTAGLRGEDLKCLLQTDIISHYDWLDSDTILVWANIPPIGARFFLCSRVNGARRAVGEGVLTEDGHCSFSPDRKWLINDTYPDRHDIRMLMLFRPQDECRRDIARLHSPKRRWWGEIRCDLHPRWNRDGTQICLDSVHSGERQMYVVDVRGYLQ
jgi:hypothetical protein